MNIRKDSSLVIEDNVTLNSRNNGYHINVHAPVKIYADKPRAKTFINENTRIHGTCVHAYQLMHIGRSCLSAANYQIMDSSGHDLSFPDTERRIFTKGKIKLVIIEDNVWIGANTLILPGVKIGAGSVIAADSVITKDISPFVVAGVNPAKIVNNFT